MNRRVIRSSSAPTLTLALTVVLAAGAASAVPVSRQTPAPATAPAADDLGSVTANFRKASLRESLRKETLTTSRSSGFSHVTESQSVSKGKTTVEVEIALPTGGEAPSAETAVGVAASAFRWEGKLGDDPKFAPGQAPGSRIKYGSATVRWSADRAMLKVEQETDEANAAVAGGATKGMNGKFEGDVTLAARFGAAVARTQVPYRAEAKRRVAGSEERYGEVVTVDVKGEGKN
jgi:hypothetical protein